jgi:hypothetical protein
LISCYLIGRRASISPWRGRSRREHQGGRGQIEYADQDPRIHALWLSELGKTGVRSRMGKLFDQA